LTSIAAASGSHSVTAVLGCTLWQHD